MENDTLDVEEPIEATQDAESDTDTQAATQDTKSVDWEKRYKDEQKFITKLSEENKQLREQMASLAGKIDGFAMASGKKPEARKSVLEQDWGEELRSDPAKAADLVKGLAQELAEMFDMRDRALMQKMRELDPSAKQIREKVQEMRSDPDFQMFSDDQLEVLARKQLGQTKRSDDTEVTGGGTFGSPTRGGRTMPKKAKANPNEELEAALWKQFGYDRWDK